MDALDIAMSEGLLRDEGRAVVLYAMLEALRDEADGSVQSDHLTEEDALCGAFPTTRDEILDAQVVRSIARDMQKYRKYRR